MPRRASRRGDPPVTTFFLRRGVKWHDGQPFTAADVKATFDRVLNPDFRSPRRGVMLKPLVAAVEVADPHTGTTQLKFDSAAQSGGIRGNAGSGQEIPKFRDQRRRRIQEGLRYLLQSLQTFIRFVANPPMLS